MTSDRKFVKFEDLEKQLYAANTAEPATLVGLDQLLTAWAFRMFLKKLGIKSA